MGAIPTTFEYSGTGERARRIRGESETVYVGDQYERETNGNVVTDRFYVHNDERVVVIVERAASGESWSFVNADHLGSVDVISNEAGFEVDRRSFDAWGAPRDPKWGGNGAASSNARTRRGFTWHEGDDDGLVNANGCIYDPKIARFLQTDPIIENPLDAQSANACSYESRAAFAPQLAAALRVPRGTRTQLAAALRVPRSTRPQLAAALRVPCSTRTQLAADLRVPQTTRTPLAADLRVPQTSHTQLGADFRSCQLSQIKPLTSS